MPSTGSEMVSILHKHSQDGVVVIVILRMILVVIIVCVLLYIPCTLDITFSPWPCPRGKPGFSISNPKATMANDILVGFSQQLDKGLAEETLAGVNQSLKQ